MDNMLGAARTVAEELQGFCDLLGHPTATIWDRYDTMEHKALVHKLKIIMYGSATNAEAAGGGAASDSQTDDALNTDSANGSPTNAEADSQTDDALNTDSAMYDRVFNGQEDADCNKPLEPQFVRLIDAIWNQRKYCNGILLMSPVFVCCVPTDEHLANGINATRYNIRPVFRIAKCFNGRSTENCCTIFVDEGGRVYPHWEDFCTHNEYGQDVVLVAPQRGIYRPDADGIVMLQSSDAHYSRVVALQTPVTCASVSATAITLGAVLGAPLIPAVAVTAAVATGVVCSGYALVAGVGRIFNRSGHEQAIGLSDRESRGIWLNVVGNSVGLAAGAAMQTVKLVARNGVQLGNAGATVVTTLGVATIATNGVSLANGVYGFYSDGSITWLEVAQLSSSLFLITHSVRNFQTARTVYEDTQRDTLETYAGALSKRQQKSYNKMLRETIRRNGNTGRADVIRSLRSISDHKGFFRDLFKINSLLNRSNVRISFDRSGRPVLNGEVPFEPSQLRADLRQQPAAEVFANATANNNSNSGGDTSTFRSAAPGQPDVSFRRSNSSEHQPGPGFAGAMTSIANNLSAAMNRRTGSFSTLKVVSLVWQYYFRNRELIHDRLCIHFDDRFVTDVCSVLCFLAEQANTVLSTFWQTIVEDVLYDQLNVLFETRWMHLAVRITVGSVHELYTGLLATLGECCQYIRDGNGFRDTVCNLLGDVPDKVMRRLLHLSKVSFGAIIAMALDEFPAFDNYFGDVLEAISQMARQSGFDDMSLYVLLMRQPEIQALHQRLLQFYERMSARAEQSMRCGTCAGSFAVLPVL